jgi:hypothetical protein
MSGDYTALAAAWQALPAGTTAQKLASLNGTMVPGPAQDVQRSDIKAILTSSGAYSAMQTYIANAAAAVQPALVACNFLLAIVDYETSTVGPTLATSNPLNLANVQQLVKGLTIDPNTGVTPAIVAQMMALITPQVLWWQMHGFAGPVTIADLIAASATSNLF